jgi:hypothetical protein
VFRCLWLTLAPLTRSVLVSWVVAMVVAAASCRWAFKAMTLEFMQSVQTSWLVFWLLYVLLAGRLMPAADTTTDALKDLLATSAVRLIGGEWLGVLARTGGVLQRRQELTEAAFASLEASSRAISIRFKLLVVSYGWISPGDCLFILLT